MHISIATEQITVQKIPKKLLSKWPPEFGLLFPDAYAVAGVGGTRLPLLHDSANGERGGRGGTVSYSVINVHLNVCDL